MTSRIDNLSVSTKLKLLPSLSISIRKPDFKTSLNQSGSQLTSGNQPQQMMRSIKPNGSLLSSKQLANKHNQENSKPTKEAFAQNSLAMIYPQKKALRSSPEAAKSKSKQRLRLERCQSPINAYKWNSPKRPINSSYGNSQIIKMETLYDDSSQRKNFKDQNDPQSQSPARQISSITLTHLHSELIKHFSGAAQTILDESLTHELSVSEVRKFATEFGGNASDILVVSQNTTLDFEMLQLRKQENTIKKCITSIKKTQQESIESIFKIKSCHEQFTKKFNNGRRALPLPDGR